MAKVIKLETELDLKLKRGEITFGEWAERKRHGIARNLWREFANLELNEFKSKKKTKKKTTKSLRDSWTESSNRQQRGGG